METLVIVLKVLNKEIDLEVYKGPIYREPSRLHQMIGFIYLPWQGYYLANCKGILPGSPKFLKIEEVCEAVDSYNTMVNTGIFKIRLNGIIVEFKNER